MKPTSSVFRPSRQNNLTSSTSHIRAGLIGAGPWGRNIVRTIEAIDGVELSLVMNQSGSRPDFVPDNIPVAAYRPELLNPETIDAVFIATPPHSHAEIAMAAMQRRLPVFVEKPLTLNRRDATAICAQHKVTPAPFFVDHIYLFHAGFRALKSALAGAGRIRAISSIGGNWGPFRTDTSTLWDWAPHDIAMCLDLVGQNPDEMTCQRPEIGKNGQGQRLAFSLTFPGPCEARISIGNIFQKRRRQITVYAETAALRFEDEAEPRVVRYPASDPFEDLQGNGETINFSGNPPLTQAVMEFCHAIRQSDQRSAQLKLGTDVVALIERLDRKILNCS
ncbi:MAG: Gfo/Idh/MocA family oxidoreductase [Proteobacteria bacterium]|nr:Gfo/Idh/MocA family oxidoreductase [Pseudomonadota bacterium]